MKKPIERLDTTSDELDALVEQARVALDEAGYQKLKAAIRTLGYVTELLEDQQTTLQSVETRRPQSGNVSAAKSTLSWSPACWCV